MDLKKLTYKLFLGIVLILICAWIVRSIVDPSAFYGNDIVNEKMKHYGSNAAEYNAIFIGSSNVLRNIDPLTFDESLPGSLGVSSYNLGSGGTTPPETYHIYEHLLRQYGDNLKYVFIELRDIGIFDQFHLHTLRKRYWMTPSEYLFVVRSNLQSSITPESKRTNFRYYGISLLERMFIIDYFNDIYGKSTEGQEAQEYKKRLLRDTGTRGYLGLEGRSLRQQQFLMDTSMLAQMAHSYRQIDADTADIHYNEVHANRILRIIEESEKRGVHLFFVLHPKHRPEQMKVTLALAKHIPERNLINLADPDVYPDLYLARHSFSDSHFNVRGSRILSRLIAEKFLEIVGMSSSTGKESGATDQSK